MIDLDIKAFFDSVPHDLVLRAVRRHTDERWILLYVERWLKAPLQQRMAHSCQEIEVRRKAHRSHRY